MSERGWGGGWTLARLAFVRDWPWAAVLVFAGLLALVRQHELARVAHLPPDAAVPAAAAVRSALWTVGFVLGLPFVVWRAALTFSNWRRGELDFLAPRAAPRWRLVGATWLGHVAACMALALALALASEVGLADTPSSRPRRVRDWPAAAWIDQRNPWRASVELTEQAPGARLELTLVLGMGAGTATEVVARAQRSSARDGDPAAAGATVTETRQRVGTRGTIEVSIPPGSEPLHLELQPSDPVARVRLVAGSGRVFEPLHSARGASLGLALRLVLLGALASALALGAGALVGPTIAVGFVLACWLLPELWAVDPSWIPSRDTFEALELTARGCVPARVSIEAWIGTVCVALVALTPCLSRSAWRRTR